MSTAVVLSWDPAGRILEYVKVNGGNGGPAERHSVQPDDAAEISAQLDGKTLPTLAECLEDDSTVLLDDVRGAVARCAVTALGPPGDRQFKIFDTERNQPIAVLPIAALGVPDAARAQQASELDYLYAPALDPPGCWLGGIGEWLAARPPAGRGSRRRPGSAGRRPPARGYQGPPDDRFVNPYTFVPFPETIERAAPGGHHRLAAGRLSGAFTVTWTFASPWQVPEGVSGTASLRLAGSSVKGAVRALHETLAGGCLRVFDADFTPAYRDDAQVRRPDWRLARVDEATADGQPLSVTLCRRVVWARAGQFQEAWGGALESGSLVGIDEDDARDADTRLSRKELPESAVVGRDGDWVVLVTGQGTRRPEIKDRKTGQVKPGAFFLACGQLGQSRAEVTEGAWRAFRIAAAGARDLQPSELKGTGRDPDDCRPQARRPMADVEFGGTRIGRRRVTTGRLWAGDVVWVRTAAEGAKTLVREVSLAALWRHPGWDRQQADLHPEQWSAGKRVPPELLACRDPADLCPSCRVFGSIDAESREPGDRARQRAYAGHVRFGDAVSEQPVRLTSFDRAPLGAPRPGAGQFYLENADTSAARAGRNPTREWGADPDKTGPGRSGTPDPRRLRGRKFYWHADPTVQPVPRHQVRSHQVEPRANDDTPAMVANRWLAPKGTVLNQRVTFDNLSRAELGGLLAAFEPHRVLPAAPGGGPLLLHLGGGKPLGLGSCTAVAGDLRVWSAASRYAEGPEETPDAEGYRHEFAASCPAALIDGVWPSLAAVLGGSTVDPARVWYPPGALWSRQRTDQEEFDKPFRFFTVSSGRHLENSESELIPLPYPADRDQSLDIATKDSQ